MKRMSVHIIIIIIIIIIITDFITIIVKLLSRNS